MNAAHIHLVINHIPVIGTIIAFLLMLLALITSNNTLKKTAGFLFVIFAIATIPVYLTGEPAEEVVEGIAGVSEGIIENHERWAGFALAGMGLLGAASLGTFAWLKKDRVMPAWYAGALLAIALIPIGLIGYTASLGGEIRHTEIRSSAAQNTEQPGQNAEGNGAGKDDDDDDR